MPLTPGSRLGVYDITAKIGEGGMGQVYRATDSNLKRQVAIKVLPASVAGDADRLARFQREAEVLAALNHPNIAQIYGLEKTADVTALVMELVEGEDLSQRIARLRAPGASARQAGVPLDEALPIAKQIAEALEAAHEQGIIHRDLKPANIKVRPDGTVKVLDFGLAKALDEPKGSSPQGLENSPTLTSPAMTQAGMVLGTAAYMSPEQASGKPVDKRADVWSFGVVLLEMLTGQRLFDGETISHTLADVLRGPIDFSGLPADTPTAIRDLLRRCLTRDVKKRTRDIGDARIAIDEVLTSPPSVDGPGRPDPRSPIPEPRSVIPSRSATLPWFVAAAALLAAGVMLTLWAPWRAEPPADRPLVRVDVDLGADVSLPAPSQLGTSVAISPDGTRLVYASGTPPRLFIRRLDQPNAVELPGTEGATSPFFSPDGQWVGFATARRASKISVEGGAVVPLWDAAGVRGASWDADDSIVVGTAGELMRMSAAGASESLAKTGDGELSLLQPQILPGGRAILFTADRPGSVDRTTIQVLTLADGRKKTVIRGGASGRYLATANGAGHLVYVNKTILFAVPFDVTTLETRGAAVPIVNDLAFEGLIGVGQFDVSGTGMLIYRRASGRESGLNTLQWVDSAGGREPLRAAPGNYIALRISPDGKRLALGVEQQGRAVWTYDPQRDVRTPLTANEDNMSPVWSPDGRHVVFGRVTGGVFLARADGARQPQALIASKLPQYPSSFTPDGRRLAYSELVVTGRQQIWTVPIEDRGGELHAGTPEPFLKSQFVDNAPAFSPDGRWLAYHSNESGTNEVYVRPFPSPASGQGSRWQVSNNSGTVPRWSRNGRELMYQAGDSIMAVSYTVSGDAFVADKPRVWIATLGGAAIGGWDLAPDGKRVLVVTPVESAEATKAEHHVVFLQNFFDELRRRVPLGK